jgi:hypothetical protein
MSMENSNAPSGIEPATFRLVVQCLNQLVYHVSSGHPSTSEYRLLPDAFYCFPSNVFLIPTLELTVCVTSCRRCQ